MKKIIIVLVLFNILFGNINIALADTIADNQVEIYDQAINTLLDLNILELDAEGLFKSDVNITRADFASILVKVLGIEVGKGDEVINDMKFSDVASDHWAAGSIVLASKIGVIKGYSDGTFRPDDFVTYEQVLKMIVCMLGYDMYAEVKGGYPLGYLAIATEKGISKKVNIGNEDILTSGMVAQLIYNALDVEILNQIGFSDNKKFNIVEGKTLLTENLNIYKRNGKVTAINKISLTGNVSVNAGEIRIDGVTYKDGGKNTGDLLGYFVTYYYKEDAYNDAKTLVSISSQVGKNDKLFVDAEDIKSYSSHKFTYWTDKEHNQKFRDINISSRVDIIFNNRVASLQDDLFTLTSGNIVFLDADVDGEYDVAFIKSYTNYVVGAVNSKEHTIYDEYDPEKQLLLDIDNESLNHSMTDTSGRKLNIEYLQEWDILTVEESLDGEYVNAVQVNSEIDSKISEVKEENGKTIVVIDDKEYKIADNYLKYLTSLGEKATLDTKGPFYLDAHNGIAAAKSQAQTDDKFAYLIDANIKSSGINSPIVFKLFTSKGEMLYLNGAEKIIIDSAPAVFKNQALSILSTNGNVVSKLVKYLLNAKGEIKELDTAAENIANRESNNSLYMSYSGYDSIKKGVRTLRYKYVSKTFSGKVDIDDKTVIFSLPSNNTTAQDKDYQVKKINYLVSETDYYIEAYKMSDNNINAAFIILYDHDSDSINTTTPLTMVEKVSYSTDEDGQILQKLYCIKDGQRNSLLTASVNLLDNVHPMNDLEGAVGYEIQPGDVIRYGLDRYGRIDEVQLVYDASANRIFITANPDGDYDEAKFRIIFGSVYEKYDDKIRITTQNLDNSQSEPNDLESYKASNFKIVLYDNTNGNHVVSTGTANDIFDYKHFRGSYSKVIISTSYGGGKTLFVFK